MKNTLISSKNSELLENLIVKYGQIVTVQQIYSEAESLMNRKKTLYLISNLTKQGWLIRIKKGLYAISDLSSRSFLSFSSLVIANLLVKDSYVSFESALQYHGMFDQLTNTVISISLRTFKATQLQQIRYRFIKTKARYYFGWQEATIDNRIARIATVEKAIVDMVNFHRSTAALDVVLEKIREHRNDLNMEHLNEYIGKCSMTTIKIFGFLFDLIGIDSSQLLARAQQALGAHRMSADARAFNAKWRLYYDIFFDRDIV